MLSEIITIYNKSVKLVDDIDDLVTKKESLISKIKDINKKYSEGKIKIEDYKRELKIILNGKTEQQQIEIYNESIKNSLEEIRRTTSEIPSLFKLESSAVLEAPINIEKEKVKRFIKDLGKKDKITVKLEKFTIYEPSKFGKLSNKLFQSYTKKIVNKYPKFFNQMNIDLKTANIQIFSSTYLSMALFSALIVSVALLLLLTIITVPKTALSFLTIFFLTALVPFATLFVFYYYPKTVIMSRSKAIKNELPFALIHMEAVAGSGARLIDIFTMLLESKEYTALSGEIKRILNYTNLMGYNLTTALKAVAKDTPSEAFKEVLSGIANVIETGGSLKQYLRDKSMDELNDYRLTRKRYVEVVSTYSEIYTALLITAPLLFIVILTIITGIGESDIAGVPIDLIQKVGTFFIIPLLNIGFIIFINLVQPEM